MEGYVYADNAPNTAEDADGQWPHWGHLFHRVVHAVEHFSVRSWISRAEEFGRFMYRHVTHYARVVHHHHHAARHHQHHETHWRPRERRHRDTHWHPRHESRPRHVAHASKSGTKWNWRKIGEWAAPVVFFVPTIGPVAGSAMMNRHAASEGLVWSVPTAVATAAFTRDPRGAAAGVIGGFVSGYYDTLKNRDFPGK